MIFPTTESIAALPEGQPPPPIPADPQQQADPQASQPQQIKGLPPGAIVKPITQPGQGGRDEDYLSQIGQKNPGVAQTVKALADGRMAFPAGFALKSPYWQNMINMVSTYDPTFDAVNYNARSQTRSKFAVGNEGKMVNNLNTAIGHLQELEAAGDALHNHSFVPWNWLANGTESIFGAPEKNNFETVLHRVAPELVSAYRGTGGAEADIKTAMEDFSTSSSPAQLHGALSETARLLESKVKALQDQYNQGMGTTEQGLTLLRPDARSALDRLQGRNGQSGGGNAGSSAPVMMRAPNGQVKPVPADQVEHYKQLGAVPVTQ